MTSFPRTSRSLRVLGAFAALALVLAACGSSSKSSSSTGTTTAGGGGGKVTLNGSGSTFQQTFNQIAIQAFQQANPNITVTYKGVGSGQGKTDLSTKDVDFAGSDSTIKEADLPSFQGGKVLYFPTVAAPITVSFNVSGLDKLQLSGPTLAQIFNQKIKTWNDSAIAADNPGAKLPSTNIVVVRRADKSGTTKNFTTFLADQGSSNWPYPADEVWPQADQAGTQAGQGNPGVAQIVKQTDGAVGYVDYSDAVQSGLKTASIKNAAGNYVAPSIEGATAAVAGATIKADLTYNPINATGAQAYPITSPTWILVYQKQTDKAKGSALKTFLTFILNDGQGLANEAKYAALPDSLKQKAIAQLDQLQIPA